MVTPVEFTSAFDGRTSFSSTLDKDFVSIESRRRNVDASSTS
jgi:hypothetical protein